MIGYPLFFVKLEAVPLIFARNILLEKRNTFFWINPKNAYSYS